MYLLRIWEKDGKGSSVMEWKYIVWVGGCDDYYTDYETAKGIMTNGLKKDMMT